MGHPANTATEHLLDIRGTVHKVSGKSEGKTCTPAAEAALIVCVLMWHEWNSCPSRSSYRQDRRRHGESLSGADNGGGILRLRMRIQKANPHASLRMTVRGASWKIPTSREGREKWGTRHPAVRGELPDAAGCG